MLLESITESLITLTVLKKFIFLKKYSILRSSYMMKFLDMLGASTLVRVGDSELAPNSGVILTVVTTYSFMLISVPVESYAESVQVNLGAVIPVRLPPAPLVIK